MPQSTSSDAGPSHVDAARRGTADNRAIDTATGHSKAWLAATLSAVALIQLPFVIWTGGFGWDDGAITVDVARTLATAGRFALTPISEIVEGSSSLGFAALLAPPFAFGDIGFDGALFWSRLLSAAFVVALAAAVWTYLRPWVGGTMKLALIVTLVGALPFFTREVINGMEMTAYAAGMVCFLILYERQSALTAPLILLLLLFRFEALFHLGVALVLLYAIERDNRRFVLRCMAVLLAGFVVITLCRYLYFGDFLPNTVRAKMNPPYTPTSPLEVIWLRIGAIIEILKVIGVPLVVMSFLFRRRFARLPEARQRRLLQLVALIAGVLGVSILIGKNWGYDGRMFLAAVPLVFMALVGLLASAPEDKPSPPAPPWFGITVACIAGLLFYNAGIIRGNLGILARATGLGHPPARADWFGITPVNYRITGTAVADIGKMLGLRSVVFMVADVGGTALCCRNLRIVDLAGLTNKQIARDGYAALPAVIAAERPDLIQTHDVWSDVSGLYDLPAFTGHYRPVIFRNTLLWLRRDHVAALKAQGLLARQIDTRALVQQDARYAYPFDRKRIAALDFPIDVIAPSAKR